MTLDVSQYPPAPVAWLLKSLDTICQASSLLQCRDWREQLGVKEGSWFSYRVGNVAESFPHFITFQEYYQSQQQLHGNNNSSISLASSLYSYALETPSTALADLTTPTAMLVLLGLVIIWRCIKMILLPFFSNLGRITGRRTHGPQWEESNQARIEKFGEYVLRLLYHSLISLYGVYYFWDKEWWKIPGGTVSLFRNYPFQEVETGMIWYYLVQSAYNLEAFLSLLQLSLQVRLQGVKNNSSGRWQFPVRVGWSPKVRGDFREMFVHHIATNLLVIGSSFFRLTRSGSMVFLVHDVSDVPVDLSKLANFLKWKRMTEVCFTLMTVMWLAARLCVLPFVIYRSILFESWIVSENIDPMYYICYRHFFFILVGLLILLHVAWFVMFLSIGYLLFFKGEAHDLSEHKKGEPPFHSNSFNSNGTKIDGGKGKKVN